MQTDHSEQANIVVLTNRSSKTSQQSIFTHGSSKASQHSTLTKKSSKAKEHSSFKNRPLQTSQQSSFICTNETLQTSQIDYSKLVIRTSNSSDTEEENKSVLERKLSKLCRYIE